MTITKEALLNNVVGQFTWMFNHIFFIETKLGNFLYSSPDYSGDNTLTQYHGSYQAYTKDHGNYGRDKGRGFLHNHLGDDFTLVLTEKPAPKQSDQRQQRRRRDRGPKVDSTVDQNPKIIVGALYYFYWPNQQKAHYIVTEIKEDHYVIQWPDVDGEPLKPFKVVYGSDIHLASVKAPTNQDPVLEVGKHYEFQWADGGMGRYQVTALGDTSYDILWTNGATHCIQYTSSIHTNSVEYTPEEATAE